MEDVISPIPLLEGRYLFDRANQLECLVGDKIFSIKDGEQVDLKIAHPVKGLYSYTFVGVSDEVETPTILTKIAPNPIYSYSTALEAMGFPHTYEGFLLHVKQLPPKCIVHTLNSKTIKSYSYGGVSICRESAFQEGEIKSTTREVLFITKGAVYTHDSKGTAYLYISI